MCTEAERNPLSADLRRCRACKEHAGPAGAQERSDAEGGELATAATMLAKTIAADLAAARWANRPPFPFCQGLPPARNPPGDPPRPIAGTLLTLPRESNNTKNITIPLSHRRASNICSNFQTPAACGTCHNHPKPQKLRAGFSLLAMLLMNEKPSCLRRDCCVDLLLHSELHPFLYKEVHRALDANGTESAVLHLNERINHH